MMILVDFHSPYSVLTKNKMKFRRELIDTGFECIDRALRSEFVRYAISHYCYQLFRRVRYFRAANPTVAEMGGPTINLIVAVCKNGGIGKSGTLPWKLKNEMAFFKKMTSKTLVEDESKQNAVIMGRKTWDSIPPKFRPLGNRINVVISTTMESTSGVLVFRSLGSAINALALQPYSDMLSLVWIIGGSSLYNEALTHPLCQKIFITRIDKEFDCDTFFPPIPEKFIKSSEEGVPEGKQEEDGIEYHYEVYKAIPFTSS